MAISQACQSVSIYITGCQQIAAVRPICYRTPRPDGSVFCQLTIHHILVDGATEQIFLAEFDRAYRGVLDETPAEKLGSYVNYLAGCDLARWKEYWKDYLKNLAPCIFPSLDVSVQRPPKLMPQILPFNFEIGQELHAFCQQNGMTASSFLQVAWGLVLRTYTGSESVCFGYLHSCRDLPIVYADRIAGPMVNILVCQLSLDKDTLALETLLANHEAYANSIEHQHCSLAEMIHSLQLSGKSLFNTVMSIQKDVLTSDSECAFEGAVEPEEGVDATEFDLTVNIATSQSRIRGDLTYWAHLHSHSQVGMIADAFHSSIMQLLRSSHSPVDSLAIAGSGNMDQILRFNKSLPESIETCIHTEIIKSSLDYPEPVAVSAWDGDLTYGELKERANAVAKELALRSVGPGTFVPILSERSKWEPVSIVAVLEAGGAFILLDPAQPQDRLQSMIHDDFDCPVIIASRRQAELAASIVSEVIVAESAEHGEVDYEVLVFNLASVSAQSACYAVFSSGSTGKPKASVIEHRSYLSAAHHHSKAMDLNAQSRALHFASNAFDAAILEILSTLLVGGCVCIPSDDERNNKLEASIAKYEVTWTLLTPSVSRVLDPRAVPTLKTLVFGGERMSLDDIRRWSPYVACMNAYGPSEASVVSTCQPSSQCLLDDPSNIGHPTGAVTWALNSHPPHKPVPLGAIGELAIEGPIVGRGYVNRPDNMKESFLPYPEWLRRIRNTANGVLYKTGDLVRMMPDGSITYLGRRDNQVKLHGQRIELAEVEHQVQRCYPVANPEVFADLVTHEASQTSYLLATIAVSLRTGEELFKKAAHETKARLRSEVPSFLAPSFLFAAEEVPRLVNGKVDRRKLQQAASQMVQTEISQSLVSHSSRNLYQLMPEQRVLQRLWADILNRPSDSIFPEDDFFAIGGDSVAAMKLSSSTATEGLDISVSDIFLHSTLKDLANVAATRQPPVLGPTNKLPHNQREAFSLLPSGHKEEILSQAMSQCCVPREQIQDVYPCTELQVGLAALTAQHQGASVARHRFRLGPGIDLNRLRKAWQTVMAGNDILRTRVMIFDTGYLQVLLKQDELLWITANERRGETLQWELVFGQPLAQFEIVPSITDQEGENSQFDLLITMHHAIYDAWSLTVLVEKATLAYHDQYTPNMDAVPFRDFIAYSIFQEEPSLAYWSKQLRELKADQFPQLPSPSYRPQPSTQIERTFHTGPLIDAWVNRTAAIRLSWALVQSQYQNSDDIVFGVISNGRTAPIQGIEAMVGPTIATYPLRVQVNRDLKGSQAIANLHQQSMELASFEQIGLSKIAALGTDGARACAFQILLMELRANDDGQGQAIRGLMQAFDTSSADDGSYTYAVQLAAMIKPEEVSVAACFDSNVVSEWQMSRMLDQFGHILQQVHVDLDRSVQDITTINRNDIQQLQSWYPEILDPGARTVVDCIHQQCITQPSSPAISSSIGDLSYEELKMRSDAVADRLFANGAGPGTSIPIYLERSQYVPVAVLSVLKTGAAFVLLDTELPLERLRTICAGISASIIISSIATQEKASRLGAEVVTLMPEEALPSSRRRYESTFGPNQPLYVSFTSGSTGAPKGVVVSNNAFMATAMGHSRVSGLSPQSQVLQFASYAFDVSILELLPTLMAGGCLCIPSDLERRDQLAETVTALRTNFAMLTPSVLRTIDPTIAVSLDTVITGGESLRPSDIQQWAPYVNLLTGYGPAEAAVTFTMSSCIRDPSQATNIGSPVAGAVHVVDPRDPQRLVPIGAIGELLLQGPQVSQGYLKNTEKTRSTFIAPPRWLKEVHQQDPYDCEAPLYCTGDLVRYGQDGSLWFMGRKDNQAKLRGQRMELGEIEEQIKRTMIGVKDVVAEVITPSSTSDSPWLAAFVTLVEPGPESSSTGIIPSLDTLLPSSFAETTAAVVRQLESVLPSYMVPSLVIPLRRMLHTPSEKVDRRLLREAIATIPRHELDRHLAPEAIDKRAPSTEAEYLLRDIWARVLRVTADEIGADDSFFRLGGDSISAVRAPVEARSSGVKHSVGELLQWQTISVVAERSAHIPTREHSWTTPVPFSLVSDSEKASVLSSVLCKMRSLMPDDVQDIIPAAPLQAFYITHSSPVSMTQSFETHFDTSRFRNACTRLVAQHTILRTAFVRHNKRFFQVILKEFDPKIEFIECADPEQWVQAKSNEPSSATTAESSIPLAFTVVTSSTQQWCMLIIQISHAQYDGLSVPVLWEDLITAYQEGELKESGQFRDVVSYRLDAENPSLPFWKDQLKGAPVSAIDPLQLTGMSQPSINDVSVELKISQPPLLSGITLSTLVKAALAWVLSQQAESSDVILGQIVHGRGGSLPNIDRTLGPCLNQLPLRVMLDAEWTVEDLLRDVQGRQVEIVANDNVSFEQIVRSCTSWPEGSTFGCFVHHQGLAMTETAAVVEICGIKPSSGPGRATSRMAAGQVGVVSIEHESCLEVRITAAENTLDQPSAIHLAKRVVDAIELFAGSPSSSLLSLA
ncbi:uncharacterized protein LDX57_004104 [Aspergillus melleus]|uniref:uncharacterized protein n=1 Tax=Aspergillus melleus TaxID=138277 RepID=UPI001E8EF25D|nr:uncharacterized protein LDX57_004104 [Aspergillus melleus]KAH8426366.1 hypothetical protein LDX57_004104 [Aspergillus melleus]